MSIVFYPAAALNGYNEIETKIRDLFKNHDNSIAIEEEREQLLEESVF